MGSDFEFGCAPSILESKIEIQNVAIILSICANEITKNILDVYKSG
jgi:hypothetical protein